MTATKKPTPTIKGQAGRVWEVITTQSRDGKALVGLVADVTGFSRAQVRVAMGTLKKMGKVVRLGPDVWRRVEAPAAALIGVGDRMRRKADGTLVTVVAVDRLDDTQPIGVNRDGDPRPRISWHSPRDLVRLPDADPTPTPAPAAPCPLVVGDHVRFDDAKTHPLHKGRVVSLHLGHLGWAAWVECDVKVAGLAPDNRFHSGIDRLIKTAPIAWAHRAGLPVKVGPATPFEQSIGRGA